MSALPRGYQKRKHGIARRCPYCGKPGGRQVVLGGYAHKRCLP